MAGNSVVMKPPTQVCLVNDQCCWQLGGCCAALHPQSWVGSRYTVLHTLLLTCPPCLLLLLLPAACLLPCPTSGYRSSAAGRAALPSPLGKLLQGSVANLLTIQCFHAA